MKKIADVPYLVTDNAGTIVQKTFATGEYGTHSLWLVSSVLSPLL